MAPNSTLIKAIWSRRRFLLWSILASPLAAVADAKWLEPEWVKVRHVPLKSGKGGHRLVHLTDVHHKGDRQYLFGVVRKINALSPDTVCFTGDMVEEKRFLPEALEILRGIKSPLYGVPGNHDYWNKAGFKELAETLSATGGAWLMDQQRVTKDGKFSIVGASCASLRQPAVKLNKSTRNVLLIHYPAWVNNFNGLKFDLLLAGHSHGGQVRFPFYGPIFLPYGVEGYDLGLFETPSGPLYVNPGIGWFPVPIRFNCRPELTVFDL